jgi:hypothetical protein
MRTAVFLIFSFILSPFYFAVIDTTRADGGRATVLTADPTLAIPKLEFGPNGELKITASATSSASDFDFLVGKWKMHNRRLNKRLENCYG